MSEIKVEGLSNKYKWIIGGVVALIAAPIAFLILKGIVGLAVAGLLGFASIQYAPVVAMKIANHKMKMITQEASANPIETLQNILIEKSAILEQVEKEIVEFDTEIRNFDDELNTFNSQYPDEANSYIELSNKMHTVLDSMKQGKEEALVELVNLRKQIEKAKAIFNMSLKAQKVTQLSRSAELQVFEDIKKKIAFDSVRTQLNKTFANLDAALEKRKSTAPSLTLVPTNTLNLNVIEGSKVEVK